MSYYGQANRRILLDGDPLHGKSIGCQNLMLPDKCWFSTNDVLARGVRGKIRALGMHACGEVRVRDGGV